MKAAAVGRLGIALWMLTWAGCSAQPSLVTDTPAPAAHCQEVLSNADATPLDVPNRAEGTLHLVFGGDLALGRWRAGRFLPAAAAADTLGCLRNLHDVADLVMVNVEGAFCDVELLSDAAREGPNNFAVPTSHAARLTGVANAAVLANNHATDCGPDGLQQTTEALSAAGLVSVGASRGTDTFDHQVLDVGGGALHVFAVSLLPPNLAPGANQVAWGRREDVLQPLIEGVTTARQSTGEAPIVVSLHWGREGNAAPDAQQRALGAELIEAGATVVFGHGAHVLQGVETMGSGVVIWNAGDLLMPSESLRHAVWVEVQQGTVLQWKTVGLPPLAP